MDPFHHHPELRGKIKLTEESFFRDLDIAAVDARAAEVGRPADWRTPCEEREEDRLSWLEGRWESDLWVFGYGSLMWDPAINFAEVRHAKATGYQRSFCLWDDGGRGSPEHPGLMLAIDTGGTCEGLAFRIEAREMGHETFVLFRREMIAKAYCPAWLTLETALGNVEALAFTANHENERIKPDIPVEEQASMIAHASGFLGSNFDYLDDTQERLSLLGIEDAYIDDLYERVVALRSSG